MTLEVFNVFYLTMASITTTLGLFTYLKQGNLSFLGILLSIWIGLIWPFVYAEELIKLYEKEIPNEPND